MSCLLNIRVGSWCVLWKKESMSVWCVPAEAPIYQQVEAAAFCGSTVWPERILCCCKNINFKKQMGGLGGWGCVKWVPPLHCSWGAASCSSYSHLDCPSPTSGSYHPKHKHRHAKYTQEHIHHKDWKPPPVPDIRAFLARCAWAVKKQQWRSFLQKQKAENTEWVETWHMMTTHDYEEYEDDGTQKQQWEAWYWLSMRVLPSMLCKDCTCVCVCVCKLTPVARTGDAEPAGTGDAWRWGELARSDSYTCLDRKGLCRRPEPRHTWNPQKHAQKHEGREKNNKEQTGWAEEERTTWWTHSVKYDYETLWWRDWRKSMVLGYSSLL